MSFDVSTTWGSVRVVSLPAYWVEDIAEAGRDPVMVLQATLTNFATVNWSTHSVTWTPTPTTWTSTLKVNQ